jgi:WD40 repeat-containing protein SMU1
MRMHGLKSGKMLKEMRGHTSYINHCTYSMDGLRLVSSGSDGFVKVSLVYFSLL